MDFNARVSLYKLTKNWTFEFWVGCQNDKVSRGDGAGAPNVWAMSRENMDFAQQIFEPYFMHCTPNIKLLPPPLN